MTNAAAAVFAAIVTCGAGAVLTLLTARRRMLAGWLAFLFTALSTVLIAAAAIQVLAGWGRWPGASWLAAGAAALRLQVDGLSTVFLMVAAVVALPASLYSIRYLGHYPGSVARYYPYFLLLLAAIFGLLTTADTLWWFLIFWQLMVFAGYILIRFDRAAGARGANRFAIMLELACAAIVAGTGVLARVGTAGGRVGYDWHTLSAGLPRMLSTAPGDSTLAFLLVFLGFAITMGLWPFGQLWLSHASPDAPAPVSALLSSVVIKIGAYGLMRYFLFLLPAGAQASFPLAKWGMAIALLGTITMFVGTMQALGSKRLLAFHSMGQMGYIGLALGTCLALLGTTNGAAAGLPAFALLAALFHIVNHSLFGSLLYLNSGSVLHSTGTKDLDRLGGLMKFMPTTALTALVGSLAISGVPLFNGFASKWAIFVAAIEGAHWTRYLAVCAVVAILTSGLTLASFIKFFGTIFLSRTS
ncbi:MAG: complex I subunit 5 family protein, partial [Chlamydiota bacterium]